MSIEKKENFFPIFARESPFLHPFSGLLRHGEKEGQRGGIPIFFFCVLHCTKKYVILTSIYFLLQFFERFVIIINV